MYKGAQDKQDWINRTGSHATRPVLSANINPVVDGFEFGRLAELKDERARLVAMLPMNSRITKELAARISAINADIKRLNREASEERERAIMWRAMKIMFDDATVRRFSELCMALRMGDEA